MFSFCFPTSFSLSAFFSIKKKKKSILFSLSQYLHFQYLQTLAVFTLQYFFLNVFNVNFLFHFSLSIPLLNFCHTSLHSVPIFLHFYCSLYAFPLTLCHLYAHCNIAIMSQQHYSEIMSDQSHAVVISDIPHCSYTIICDVL